MFIARTLTDDLFARNEMRHFVSREKLKGRNVVYKHLAPMERRRQSRFKEADFIVRQTISRDTVGCLGMSEEVFARLFCNKARAFQFKVSALNLAFINGEFLRQHSRCRERFAGRYGLAAYLRFNLFADLQVDGAFGQVLKFDVHL